jgi:hypothetical protein
MGRLDRWIRALLVLNAAIVATLLVVVVVDATRSAPGHPNQAAAGPTAAPTELMAMGLAHIPTSNSCVLCHENGGDATLKTVPAIGHPLEGWRECLVCHTNVKLGRSVPGHDGIPQEECLNCHQTAVDGPAITQPHSKLQDQRCLDCHGKVAHLPSTMAGRNEDDCRVCHKPASLPPPAYPHALNPSLECRDCHRSPEVGNLPIDHALRSSSVCLLCHEILTTDESPAPTALPLATGSPGTSAAATALPLPGSVVPASSAPSQAGGSPSP